MKVANTSASTTLKDDALKSESTRKTAKQSEQPKATQTTQNTQEESARVSKAPTPRSLGKEEAKDLGAVVKNANTTIGALDVMIRSIHSLQTQNKTYQKLALKLQNLQDNTQEAKDLTSKADAVKDKMQATFDSALFNDENVFTKSYAEIPESHLNAKKLSPNKLDIKQPENLSLYAKDLSEQRSYAKQAKKLVQSALDEKLDSVQKTDSRYAKLESSRLNPSEFKAAQGSSGVTLDRVLHLLR
ncbi:hypothetical protein [Helicobacter canis]|uniref:hypothetical protein n=1 Tax=Helicobacter canis TaxID=29419 RepID=UPI00294267A7|nr:hypothetical protein [Helicobacter canis]